MWRRDEYSERNFDSRLHLGFIAQEVEKVLPDLVDTDEDGWKSIQTMPVIAVLVEALKDMNDVVNLFCIEKGAFGDEDAAQHREMTILLEKIQEMDVYFESKVARIEQEYKHKMKEQERILSLLQEKLERFESNMTY